MDLTLKVHMNRVFPEFVEDSGACIWEVVWGSFLKSNFT